MPLPPTSFATLGSLPDRSKLQFPHLGTGEEDRVQVIELLRGFSMYSQPRAWLSAQHIINTCEASAMLLLQGFHAVPSSWILLSQNCILKTFILL